MILYETSGAHFLCRIFQLAGSVFPKASLAALPCALLTVGLTIAIQQNRIGFLQGEDRVLKDNAAWGGFSFLVGFIIVFRTSQSYNRFWDGCTSTHRMGAEWFDGASALIAFCKHSKADQEKMGLFQNTLVRLFSMLHALALAEIEDSNCHDIEHVQAFKYELVDVAGIDAASLEVVRNSHARPELVFQWIQQLIVENISTGVLSIPPPILSRSFQEIANGMVAFHDAMKISTIPFPFPYAQSCDFLLVLHWLVTPFVVSQWVTEPFWAAIFSFVQVFILWALNFIAIEIEMPFGTDANDIDGLALQKEMNEHLLLLVHPGTLRTPGLSTTCQDLRLLYAESEDGEVPVLRRSFSDIWSTKPPSSPSSAGDKLSALSSPSHAHPAPQDSIPLSIITKESPRPLEVETPSGFAHNSSDKLHEIPAPPAINSREPLALTPESHLHEKIVDSREPLALTEGGIWHSKDWQFQTRDEWEAGERAPRPPQGIPAFIVRRQEGPQVETPHQPEMNGHIDHNQRADSADPGLLQKTSCEANADVSPGMPRGTSPGSYGNDMLVVPLKVN